MGGFASVAIAAAYDSATPASAVISLLVGGVLLFLGLRLQLGRRAPEPPAAANAFAVPAQLPSAPWTPPATNDPGDFFGTGTTLSATTPTVMPGWTPPAAPAPVTRPGAYSAPAYAAPASAPQPARGGRNLGALALCTLGVLFLLGGVLQGVALVLVGQRHTVALPATAQTFHLMTPTAQMQQALDSAKTSLPGDTVTKIEAGYYTDGSGTLPAAALVVAETVGDPDADAIFSGFRSGASTSGLSLAIAPADTQGLGGRMECGTVTTSQGPLGVCLWVDHGTIGLVMTTPTETSPPATVANTLRRSAES